FSDIITVLFLSRVNFLFHLFFFFNATTTTEIYTLSLHDALPILALVGSWPAAAALIILERVGKAMRNPPRDAMLAGASTEIGRRSEEHTSELQSRGHLVCRLLLEKKKKNKTTDKYVNYRQRNTH